MEFFCQANFPVASSLWIPGQKTTLEPKPFIGLLDSLLLFENHKNKNVILKILKKKNKETGKQLNYKFIQSFTLLKQ
jgi:hypothetical protein